MIVDLILDRRDDLEEERHRYCARGFYSECMEYSKVFDGIGDGITRAMDNGNEDDVKRELCRYIIDGGYALDICTFINSVDWLIDDNITVIEEQEQNLRIKKLNGVLPLTDEVGPSNDNSNSFAWYKIKDKNDFSAIQRAYRYMQFNTPPMYPNILCVKYEIHYKSLDGKGEPWYLDSYYLSDLIKESKDFWKRFGYKLELKNGLRMQWLIDGKQRCTTLDCYLHDGFKISPKRRCEKYGI